MQTLTLEQLRAATDAGGVSGVEVKAQGGSFVVEIVTHNGEAILAKARSTEPRRFGNPFQAMTLLRTIGIVNGAYDMSGYNPDQGTARTRPDRARAMKRAQEAIAHDSWFREQVQQAVAEADDPATKWASHDEVLDDMERQRESIRARMATKK